MPFDPLPLLDVLAAHGVDFVIIGGVAGRLHGASRPTFDIDVVPAPSTSNLERLADALTEMGARLRVGDGEEMPAVAIDAALLTSWQMSTWITRLGPIDVLADVAVDRDRLDYERLRDHGVEIEAGGLVVAIIGLEDLIANKRSVGRPKDLQALGELERIRRDEPGSDR